MRMHIVKRNADNVYNNNYSTHSENFSSTINIVNNKELHALISSNIFITLTI